MGLLATFRKAAAIGFKLAGDTKKPIVVYGGPVLAGNYDIELDKTTTAWTKTKPLQALVSDAVEERDKGTKEQKPESQKRAIYIEGAELDGFDLEAEMEVDAEGFRWKVEKVDTDPVRALVTFTVYR